MVGDGNTAPLPENLFVLSSDYSQTIEEPTEGHRNVNGQENREGEELEPKVEVDEGVGFREIDLLDVSLNFVDLLFRDLWPFLHLRRQSLSYSFSQDVVRLWIVVHNVVVERLNQIDASV